MLTLPYILYPRPSPITIESTSDPSLVIYDRMDHRVEGFPFNIIENPMYVGSTLCFAATALWYEKPAGVFVTLWVHICYSIALRYEG